MGAEPWGPGQLERYTSALDNAWDDFETAYYATVKRVGLGSIAATHAGVYMRKAKVVRDIAKALLAKPTRTDETPEAIRNAVKELTHLKAQLSYL